MKINANKTKTLIVGRSCTSNPIHPPISICKTIFNNCDHLTIFSVFFIDSINKIMNSWQWTFYLWCKNHINLICFRSFALPLPMAYCSLIWNSPSDNHVNLHNRISNSANFLFFAIEEMCPVSLCFSKSNSTFNILYLP